MSQKTMNPWPDSRKGSMEFRDILVVLRAYPGTTTSAAVEGAAATALALRSRVSVISCGIKPQIPGNIVGNAVFDVSALAANEAKKSIEDAQRLLAAFDDVMSKHGASCKQILEIGRASDVPRILAGYARLRDLTILPVTNGPYVSQLDTQWYAETILFESGRPMIVVPQKAKRAGLSGFNTVMIAWDNGRAASRAVADSMPILRAARRVSLLTVFGEKPIVSDASAAQLAEHLAIHGIDVSLRQVEAAGRTIGQVFEDEVRIGQVDLLVMGAYGRSRLREFILGGATKSALTDPPTTLCMSH
jgi:nucleotide-binding universal stress UspA family protein